jgi:hypothetical protein
MPYKEESDEPAKLDTIPARFLKSRRKNGGRLHGFSHRRLRPTLHVTSAATSAAPSERVARGPMRAIDIHHHYSPPELVEEIKKHGKALGIEYFPPRDAVYERT